MWQRNTGSSPNPIDPITGGAMKTSNPLTPAILGPRQRTHGSVTPRREALLAIPKGLGALPGV